jgi:hypothetical protein
LPPSPLVENEFLFLSLPSYFTQLFDEVEVLLSDQKNERVSSFSFSLFFFSWLPPAFSHLFHFFLSSQIEDKKNEMKQPVKAQKTPRVYSRR